MRTKSEEEVKILQEADDEKLEFLLKNPQVIDEDPLDRRSESKIKKPTFF